MKPMPKCLNLITSFLFVTFLTLSCGTIQSNIGSFKMIPKNIVIDSNFIANSTEMKIKRKNSKGFAKYEFGDYKVVKGNKSRKKSSSKGFPFKNKRTDTKSQRKSFVLVKNNTDTLRANFTSEILEHYEFINKKIDWNPFSETFLNASHEVDAIESKKSFTATFIETNNLREWQLIIIQPRAIHGERNSGFDEITEYKALLIDENTVIEIDKIVQDEPDKMDIYSGSRSFGYEFYLKNELIASVNLYPINNRILWILNGLDNGIEMAIAATAVSLCESSFNF